MQGVHLRKYGIAATIPFELYEVDGVDFRVDAVHGAGDSTRVKDGGAEQNTTNGFADEGKGYSITLTAGEMQAAEIVVYVVDQTATKVWLDKVLVIETYGNAAAQHAMDLDDAVRGGMTALPNAAADAAGGLPISDVGGLDLDTLLGTTSVPTTLQNTTIATLASQTSFTLTAGSADDNAYIGCLIIIEDSITATQKAVGLCSAYTGSSKTVVLIKDPGVFTMAVGDTVDVIAASVAKAVWTQIIETGLDARQSVQLMGSAMAGKLAGAATNTVTIAAMDNAGTNRITATVDSAGNRTSVVVNPST